MDDDVNAAYRERRRLARRRRTRARRIAAAFALAGLVAAGALLAPRVLSGGGSPAKAAPTATARRPKPRPKPKPVRMAPPAEIRGVHVSMPLASLAGKIDEYLALPGLNTIELDVKDENGQIGFVGDAPPLARQIGAARRYYRPETVARAAHAHGVYLVGRVVVFEDPVLAEKRPGLAVHRDDGSIWKSNGGLAWTNPYDRRVWNYDVAVARAAARAGFDEIQFDYVRFPSDGDLAAIRYPTGQRTADRWTVPAFLHYATGRLHPLGVHVSADVFGLSATHDLGVGQVPSRISRYVDAVSPMVYPSHYSAGEFELPDPNAEPGLTVARSLIDFGLALRGRKARLVPWLQDFSLGRTYTAADVAKQIAAARDTDSDGFLLWNPEGVYTAGALTGR